MPQKQKIIIDTDPGQDDAVAILLALGSEELDVLGITAVAGNVPLRLTEKNARKICELAGKPQTRVFAGASRPIEAMSVTFSSTGEAAWTAKRFQVLRMTPASATSDMNPM